ncbi:MAG: hypothetical protein FJ368_00260 [Pelagibacterales bacterium]|nr:hypothetical protein [Pelagibacterales bacterium]
MKKNYFTIALLFLLISCSSSRREAPTIYFSNVSPDMVKDIRVNWVSKNVLTLPNLGPGDSRTQTFYIKQEVDFFGDVSVSWMNARGEKLMKNFTIQKDHLPSIKDKFSFSYVQFYFSQDDIEIITSDIVDISGKSKMMDRLMIKHRSDAELRGVFVDCVPSRINLYNCPGDAVKSVLIRVQSLD